MSPRTVCLLPALALMGACAPAEVLDDVVTADIVAADGGEVVHPSGAIVRIPPGALSSDATIRLRDGGVHPPDPAQDQGPLLSWSPRFGLDLGGADLEAPLSFGIVPPPVVGGDVDVTDDDLTFVLASIDTNGVRRLHAVVPDDTNDLGHLFGPVDADDLPELGLADDGFLDLELEWVPPMALVLDDGVLQAPFYSQDGLQWCELTSMAMLYNFHGSTPTGLTSQWAIAADYGTPADVTGAPPDGVLEASGGLAYAEGIYWNAELIPSAPFSQYVQNVIGGRASIVLTSDLDDGELGWMVWDAGYDVPARPVQTTSSVPGGLHGYLITGADDDGLVVHDSSGALTAVHGMAADVTWEDYRSTVAKDGDKDIWTAVLNLPVRPEEERRGSLVLRGGSDPGSSFAFLGEDSSTLKWLWDGEAPHAYGYTWGFDVGACDDPTADLGCNFRGVDGVVLGSLQYRFYVANTTQFERDYRVDLTLWQLGGGGVVEQAAHVIEDAAPYTWHSHEVAGTLSLDTLHDAGRYELYIVLRQDDVVQDVKTIRFEVRM